jgi:hypothetical protein
MQMKKLKPIFFVIVIFLVVLPFSCKKKNKGKTVTISFDISGRILNECDSTPVVNCPISIVVQGEGYYDLNAQETTHIIGTSEKSNTNANGYYHIISTVVLNNVVSVENTYGILNHDFNTFHPMSGPGGFTFTTGTLKDAYLNDFITATFVNGGKIYISDTFHFFTDNTDPIYFHLSNVRDSNLTNRFPVTFGKSSGPGATDFAYSDSAHVGRMLIQKTWYTYEVKLANGSSYLFKKDSFFTGCNSRIRISL